MSTDAHPSGMSKFNPPPKSKIAEEHMSYKDQLDQAAHEAREPESNKTQESVVDPVIEKVTEYVPVAAKVLGDPKQTKEEKRETEKPPGPPERPIDDHAIEEFMREQHRSKGEDGGLQ